MSLRIKKNDKVVVIAGKNRGTTSKVLFVIPSKSRAVVEHVNMVKRHTRCSVFHEHGCRGSQDAGL
jgi:large subunit ribosomal protein L24